MSASPGASVGEVIEVALPDVAAMVALGVAIAGALQDGDVLLLRGELGVGKTTLVMGLAAGLGCDGAAVRSPTFSLVDEHARGGGGVLLHADLYRVDADGLPGLGLVEELGREGVIAALEWPAVVAPFLDAVSVVEVDLATAAGGGRCAKIVLPPGRPWSFAPA